MVLGTANGSLKGLIPLLCTMNLLLAFLAGAACAEIPALAMRNYCSAPPVDGFKPNLLLMIDNSSSMYDLAYSDPDQFCLDDSYDNTTDYPGYFDQQANYLYNLQTGSFETAAGPLPSGASCNQVRRDYLCLNLAGSGLDRFQASGRFLNWLAMSKLDVTKKALTGGKYDTDSGLLLGESRGCQGKRFVKMLGDAPVTFAIRGPISTDSDYLYRASYGGLTRIEVYPSRFNKVDCLAAVTAWQSGSISGLQKASLGCLGSAETDEWGAPSKAKVYTEVMADCSDYLANPAKGLKLDGQLVDDCMVRIVYVYEGDSMRVPKNNGDDVCGKGLYHAIAIHNGTSNSSGYLGECYSDGGIADACAVNTLQDYCAQIITPTVTDPAAAALRSGTSAGLPSYILDAGIFGLGPLAGTLQVRVPANQPAGLIQGYAGLVNFGAMVFNDNGAGSECGDLPGQLPCLKHCRNANAPPMECYRSSDCDGETPGSGICVEEPRLDGGRIVSYLNYAPVGDHHRGSGLVAAIDAVRADSWTPLGEAFYEAMGYFGNRPELRLQSSDFDLSLPPVRYPCQRNNILMLTDGISTADRSPAVLALVAAALEGGSAREPAIPASRTTTDPAAADPPNGGSYNLDDLAWIARNRNLANPALSIRGPGDYLSTYVVYTGVPCGTTPESYLPDGSCVTSDEAVPEKMMQMVAAKGGGGIVAARRPQDLEGTLRAMLQLIGSSANTGTDASILSSGAGNGAIYLQEQFYPTKSFDGGATSASWIGEMQGLWYYIDPFVRSSGEGSTIREDSDADSKLDLIRDRVVRFSYGANKPQAQLYLDGDGNGTADQATGPVLDPDQVKSLWRAGRLLWSRDLVDHPRDIYTALLPHGSQVDDTGMMRLSVRDPDNTPALLPYLQTGDSAGTATTVRYLLGYDTPWTPDPPASGETLRLLLRSRTVRIGDIPAAKVSSVSSDPFVSRPRDRGVGVWKLGDIVSSTPALQTTAPLGSYHLPPPGGYGDTSYRSFLNYSGATSNYRGRGTAYVGANDGMLHAFRLGILAQQAGSGASWPATRKATLSGSDPGWEEWGFIPKNALPYLKYLQELGYPHLNYVDGGLTLVDASLGDPGSCPRPNYWDCPRDQVGGKNWRTVLVGGMGLGGASRGAEEICTQGSSGTCVKAPAGSSGLSSYFALDVTGQRADGGGTPPRLLWEFAPPGLGFATSGAAIIRVSSRSGPDLATRDKDSNGRWFAVFASGPTGSIDSGSCQFLGKSDQNLKLFAVDLNAVPPLVEGVNYWSIDTRIPFAFGGSLAGAGLDADRWNPQAQGFYQDDVLYLGYTRKGDDGNWNAGGVLRLFTRENPDPRQWVVARLLDGIGPVTGALAKLQDRRNGRLWLYFGTGRYFFQQDDLTEGRSLYGIKEPCYSKANTLRDTDLWHDQICSTHVFGPGDLTEARDPVPGDTLQEDSSAQGWRIPLDPAGGGAGSERSLGAPAALTNGSVFFTTFKPSAAPCESGTSYLWRVRYNSGGRSVTGGSAVLPLSGGTPAELPLAGWTDHDGRRSPPLAGKPAGVKLVTNGGLKPLKKVIHIQER